MTAAILTITCIILAAFFKAVSDTLAHHFETSIFKWKDPRWWKPDVSCNYVGFIRGTKYRADAWHLANSGMIASFCLALCLHERLTGYWFEPLLTFFLSGFLFNLAFNLFYNHILRKKP